MKHHVHAILLGAAIGAIVTAAVGLNLFVGYREMTEAAVSRFAQACCPEALPIGGAL